MYKRVLEGFEAGLAVRPVKERMERPVALVWKDWNTMPFAARKFVSYVLVKFYKPPDLADIEKFLRERHFFLYFLWAMI